MPRARQQIPTYLNRRGRGAVVVYRGGVRTEITLPGKYGSKESKQEYEAHLRVADDELPEDPRSKLELTVGEFVVRFMEYAEGFYVHPGTKEPTGEMPVLRAAFRPLLRLHSRTPAANFGPLALKAIRKAMVSGSWQTPEEQAHVRNRSTAGPRSGAPFEIWTVVRRGLNDSIRFPFCPPLR